MLNDFSSEHSDTHRALPPAPSATCQATPTRMPRAVQQTLSKGHHALGERLPPWCPWSGQAFRALGDRMESPCSPCGAQRAGPRLDGEWLVLCPLSSAARSVVSHPAPRTPIWALVHGHLLDWSPRALQLYHLCGPSHTPDTHCPFLLGLQRSAALTGVRIGVSRQWVNFAIGSR